jgi:hypothetical protein
MRYDLCSPKSRVCILGSARLTAHDSEVGYAGEQQDALEKADVHARQDLHPACHPPPTSSTPSTTHTHRLRRGTLPAPATKKTWPTPLVAVMRLNSVNSQKLKTDVPPSVATLKPAPFSVPKTVVYTQMQPVNVATPPSTCRRQPPLLPRRYPGSGGQAVARERASVGGKVARGGQGDGNSPTSTSPPR